MTDRPLSDRLDEFIDAIVGHGDATGALRDPDLAPLARMAADLRHYPSPGFKARLRAELQRRATMTTVTAVREGFTTVTPYIRVPDAGLVDFLARTFDAQETFSGRGGGGGMHREVRIGDSMLMIGEGTGTGGVMPVSAMAFHVFVQDADATFRRAIAAGGTSVHEPADYSYGERAGFVRDRFGNHWYIATPLGPQSVGHALRTVTPMLHVRDGVSYVDFLKRALDAAEELRHEEPPGRLRYARLRIGDAAVELTQNEPMTGAFMLYVADPDAAYQRALAAGATSLMEPSNQPYGRVAGVGDAVGNQWFFSRPERAEGAEGAAKSDQRRER